MTCRCARAIWKKLAIWMCGSHLSAAVGIGPAASKGDSVAQIYPLDIVRRIERRWQRRLELAAARAAQTGSSAGDVRPVCKGNASISDVSAENISPQFNEKN